MVFLVNFSDYFIIMYGKSCSLPSSFLTFGKRNFKDFFMTYIHFIDGGFDIAEPGVDAVLETVSSFLLTCSVEKFILTS